MSPPTVLQPTDVGTPRPPDPAAADPDAALVADVERVARGVLAARRLRLTGIALLTFVGGSVSADRLPWGRGNAAVLARLDSVARRVDTLGAHLTRRDSADAVFRLKTTLALCDLVKLIPPRQRTDRRLPCDAANAGEAPYPFATSDAALAPFLTVSVPAVSAGEVLRAARE